MNASTHKPTAARAQVERMQAQQLRQERRVRLAVVWASVAVVALILAGLVVVKVVGGRTTGPAPTTGTASAAVMRDVSTVPASVLDQIGAGTAQNPPVAVKAPRLTAEGLPRIVYVGAEYCPFCAAQRWPLIVALSRFGTWSHLDTTTSASNDSNPNTPTLSFHGAVFTSTIVSFTGYETSGNTWKAGAYMPLDTLTPADETLFATYDRPPFVRGSGGGIPFLDIAGLRVVSGASYDPALLAGKTHEQIAASFRDATNPLAAAVDGSANVLTAAICEASGGRPATVCGAPGVQSAEAQLGTGQ